MSSPARSLGYVAGLIIPAWLLFGVIYVASQYPGYSHFSQALSALGAVDAPTHTLSPLVNNFPLGALFLVFAIALYATPQLPRLSKASAFLIGLHGLCSIGTGLFSCDAGCKPVEPSSAQQLHNLFGLLMALSLLVASALWSYIAFKSNRRGFGFFSIAMTFATLTTLTMTAAAAQMDNGFGLYQRLNYGASVIWIAGLAVLLLRERKRA